jgi:hypothetical protein
MTPEQWEGYQECIKDVLGNRWVDREGRQVGFVSKVGPNKVGEYTLVRFENGDIPMDTDFVFNVR